MIQILNPDTQMQKSAESASGSKDVADILQAIMSMQPGQRGSLRAAWDAIEPPTAFPAAAVPFDASPATDSNSDEPPGDELSPWILSIADLPKRQRFALLEDALEKSLEQWETDLIQAEIRKIKDEDSVFAIEVAVTRYAYEHPVFFMLGVVGFMVGAFQLGRGALRLLF